MGAGSIGCYVGGRLLAAGYDVRLVGRPSLVDAVAKDGLRISDCDGYAKRLESTQVRIDADVRGMADCDVVLVTVKSLDTAAAGAQLAPVLKRGALIVSLQNGIRNPTTLAAGLPDMKVVAGMVPFNVVRKPDGTFHRGTSGDLLVGADAGEGARMIGALVTALNDAGVPSAAHEGVVGVQWGKLLFNLNNALNALAGIPLKEELSQRRFRILLAALMAEGLTVMRAAGIKPAASLKVPPGVVPHVLRLPDGLFAKLAGTMLKVDPEARSSMWEDLERRRPTEVDYLNGEIVRLAVAHGRTAPLNERIVALVRRAETTSRGSPRLAADVLARELGLR